MKKTIAVILVLASLFAFASCSKNLAPMDEGEYFYANKAEGFVLPPDFDDKTGETSKFVENPFVNTSENAVSTFSADVDTAAYSYLRKLIKQGYNFKELKSFAGNTVRTEELVNYFHYSYKAPDDGEVVGTKTTVVPCPWNEENLLLTIGLSTAESVVNAKNNLVFLIDVSGSMASSDKLPLLKTAFSYLVSALDDDDTVSIVTYSGKETVVLEGCKGSKGLIITDSVNSLSASGSTYGEAGLKKAYAIAEKYFIADGNNRIIMASDGDLNVGISSPEELKNFVSEKKGAGVYLSVLGFGTGNYRDGNMEALADAGNGVYYYIDSEEEAEKVFGGELFSTLYTVAEDVKFQITFDPEKVEKYRLIGYENRLLETEDFDDDTKDAGDLGSGHRVTVCYEITPKETESEKENIATLAVRYKTPGSLQSELREYDVSGEVKESDSDVAFVSAVIEFSMLLHESEYLTDGITLESIISDIDEIGEKDSYKYEFRELLDKLLKAE